MAVAKENSQRGSKFLIVRRISLRSSSLVSSFLLSASHHCQTENSPSSPPMPFAHLFFLLSQVLNLFHSPLPVTFYLFKISHSFVFSLSTLHTVVGQILRWSPRFLATGVCSLYDSVLVGVGCTCEYGWRAWEGSHSQII